MDQIPQDICLGPKGPNDRAEGYSLPQVLEKDREVGFFFSRPLPKAGRELQTELNTRRRITN